MSDYETTRAALLARFAAALDAQEAARGINDPDKFAEAMDAAYRDAVGVFSDAFGPNARARAVARTLGRRVTDPEGFSQVSVADCADPSFGSDLTEAYRGADAAAKDAANSGELAKGKAIRKTAAGYTARARRALTGAMLDLAPLIPSTMARDLATALYLLNLGDPEHPLVRPARLKANAGRTHGPRMVFAIRVYYRAGYEGITLESAWSKELLPLVSRDGEPEPLFNWTTFSALEKFVTGGGLAQSLNEIRDQGIADKAEGRGYCVPTVEDYDLAEIEKLTPRKP